MTGSPALATLRTAHLLPLFGGQDNKRRVEQEEGVLRVSCAWKWKRSVSDPCSKGKASFAVAVVLATCKKVWTRDAVARMKISYELNYPLV